MTHRRPRSGLRRRREGVLHHVFALFYFFIFSVWDTVLTACRVGEEDPEDAKEIVAGPGVVFDTVFDGHRARGGVLEEEL